MTEWKAAAAPWYVRLLGGIFGVIAIVMIVSPQSKMMEDGVDFDRFPVAGKAEVRAWYFGTALLAAWVCLVSETAFALQAIAVILGGFAAARVVGYSIDGVDENGSRHQHAVFVVEVIGCGLALILFETRPLVQGKRPDPNSKRL
eukprot:m.102280 g.102280  ORF g.102280 m.102280 type:complete len:145 (+) comp20799_c0_seq1:155-589(+)